MTTGTRVRDWATVDFYAVLGVARDASDDEIARAFRARAKVLHPDTGHADRAVEDEFKELSAAYAVLGDHRMRRDYDRVRAELVVAPVRRNGDRSKMAPVTSPPARRPWTRRRAWTVVIAGIVLTVLGVAAIAWTWALHARDADERARFTPVTATRVTVDGRPRIEFQTADGRTVQTREPRRHGDPVEQSSTVKVRYDPADPTHVVPDTTTFGRDITLAIVALKLLIGGPVFVAYGARRLRTSQ
jgi:hypothetical protein